MLQSGKADPEERDDDGRGLTPMEYTDPAIFERKYAANADKSLSPHREEIRRLLVQAIAQKHAEEGKRMRDFLSSHPVEEPVPDNYRHRIGWTSGKPGITLCLYEIRNADGTCGSVLRFRRDSTGMLLREASGHISRGTQGHIPYMPAPRLCWIPQEGVPGDSFVIYAPGRVWTPFAIMRLEWGRDCGEPESASLPPEGLPILTPLYQGTINAYRPRHRLREKDGKRYIDFYDAAEDEPDSASPRASFYLPIEPAKQ